MAKAAQALGTQAMTEDELQTGITEALTFAGWRWFHVRRSDLAIVEGFQGFPDIFAVHGRRRLTLILELKAQDGRLSAEQGAWFAELGQAGHGPIVIRPTEYDDILKVILGGDAGQLRLLDGGAQ